MSHRLRQYLVLLNAGASKGTTVEISPLPHPPFFRKITVRRHLKSIGDQKLIYTVLSPVYTYVYLVVQYLQLTTRFQLVSMKDPGRAGRPARQVSTLPCWSADGTYTTLLIVTLPSGLVCTSGKGKLIILLSQGHN
jgi:hypothetical protein